MAVDYGTILALLLTLAIFSFLYKETLLFRFAEHMFLGVAIGHSMVTSYKYVVDNAWTPMLKGNIMIVPGFILGGLILLFLSERTKWISLWPIAFMTGAVLGLGVRAIASVNLAKQIIATFQPFTLQLAPSQLLNPILVLIGTCTALIYFTFTYEHKGSLGVVGRVGRIFLMLALGGYFGNTVMSRLSLLGGRLTFILQVLGLMPS